MNNRIQFCADGKVKTLTQKFVEPHDQWLAQQVDEAFSKLERGEVKFFSQDAVDARMEALKQRLSRESK